MMASVVPAGDPFRSLLLDRHGAVITDGNDVPSVPERDVSGGVAEDIRQCVRVDDGGEWWFELLG